METKDKQINELKKFIFICTAILAIHLIGLSAYIRSDINKTLIEINQVNSLIQQRNHLDSLYWHHLEQCAFEQRAGVEPDIWN